MYKPFRKLPTEIVEWKDATGCSGWASDGDGEPVGMLMTIRSVGYLLKETKDTLTLCQSIDDSNEEQTDNRLSIPKSIITKRWVIRPDGSGWSKSSGESE